MRLAAFHKSRADVMIDDWYDEVGMPPADIADVFDPARVDFARAKPPTQLAMDLAREAMKLGSRSSSRQCWHLIKVTPPDSAMSVV